jgi:hypothetical protein
MSVTVHTQTELDAALKAGQATIYIESEPGVRLSLNASGSSHVVARGSAHVVAWGSSHVEARGSAHVEARDSAHVEAWDSAHVVAWGSAHVVAWDSAHVEAWGSAHVEAGRFVAVHLHSQRVTLDGGVVFDMTAIDRNDPTTWCELVGVKVVDGVVTLYKAVDANLCAGLSYKPTTYPIGETVICPDWRDDNECGGGLHLSPTPSAASRYNKGATRWLRVEANLADLRPIDDKCKVRECRVVAEVDRRGREVTA